jgi:hypothetical protein
MSLASAAGRYAAQEFIRQRQQGLGRPIIAAKIIDRQFVTVGETLYQSSRWKSFPDFLNDYIRSILDPAWGNAEIAKPFGERHPILQWYDTYCRYQRTFIHTPGVVCNGVITGVVACYLGLAYNLYLLDHNVELQTRLVRRLKNVGNFQGAYYELMIANAPDPRGLYLDARRRDRSPLEALRVCRDLAQHWQTLLGRGKNALHRRSPRQEPARWRI